MKSKTFLEFLKKNANEELAKVMTQQFIDGHYKKLYDQKNSISCQEQAEMARDLQSAKQFQQSLPKNLDIFLQRVNNNQQYIEKAAIDKLNILQEISSQTERSIHQANQQVKNLEESMAKKKQKIQTQKKWISMTQEFLRMQLDDQQLEVRSYANSIESCKIFDGLVNILIHTLEQREQRKIQIQQFIKKTKRPGISIKNPQPVLKKAKFLPDSNRPQIEFIPQNKEMIFNVWTFQGQIVQFILFFDPDSRKFGLKNPSRTFQSFDLNAVRAFNFHKSFTEFYEQLCLLVSRHIDDVDDLAVYEGN